MFVVRADSAPEGGSGLCHRWPLSRSPPSRPGIPQNLDQSPETGRCGPALWELPIGSACVQLGRPRPSDQVTAGGEDRPGSCEPAGQVEAKAWLPGVGASTLPVLSLHPSWPIPREWGSQITPSPFPEAQTPTVPSSGLHCGDPPPSEPGVGQHHPPPSGRRSLFTGVSSLHQGPPVWLPPASTPSEEGVSRPCRS